MANSQLARVLAGMPAMEASPASAAYQGPSPADIMRMMKLTEQGQQQPPPPGAMTPPPLPNPQPQQAPQPPQMGQPPTPPVAVQATPPMQPNSQPPILPPMPPPQQIGPMAEAPRYLPEQWRGSFRFNT